MTTDSPCILLFWSLMQDARCSISEENKLFPGHFRHSAISCRWPGKNFLGEILCCALWIFGPILL